LSELGAEVTGYSLPPPTVPSHFKAAGVETLVRHVEADIRDALRLRKAVAEAAPDIVFHLAAQPLVRRSYEFPLETVETNIVGTANLLEAVRGYGGAKKRCAVVVITSDKCYENREWVYGYREDDPMGGHDPYSMSKGAAELLISSWRRSFFPPSRIAEHGVRLSSSRAGNVLGGGDWGQDRIMTDCIDALRRGQPVGVRNPLATRPWQHVFDPLSGYLLLGQKLLAEDPTAAAPYCEAWNFGPPPENVWTVERLVSETVRLWGGGRWEDHSDPTAPHEARLLALSCDKVYHRLSWRPVWGVETALEKTVAWFREFEKRKEILSLSLAQIREYVKDARKEGRNWAASGAEVAVS
jgi:CDP-glucose 4,6-dehydratase